MNNLLLLLIISLLSCLVQVCQKQAVIYWQSNLLSKKIFAFKLITISIILMIIGMFFWLKLLHILPLSVAYPMLSINFIIVTLIGQVFYKEKISVEHWFGIFIIMFGIVLLNI